MAEETGLGRMTRRGGSVEGAPRTEVFAASDERGRLEVPSRARCGEKVGVGKPPPTSRPGCRARTGGSEGSWVAGAAEEALGTPCPWVEKKGAVQAVGGRK